MATPFSTSVPYATGADLLLRYDARYLGDLLLDIGAQADYEAIKNGAPDLPEGSIVQEFLMDSSGRVEAACLKGKRYSPSDLSGLTGASKRFLAGLVCDLAIWGLQCRRKPDSEAGLRTQLAMSHLKQLKDGDEIFGTMEAAGAGLPTIKYQTEQELEMENATTLQAERLFGVRSDRNRSTP